MKHFYSIIILSFFLLANSCATAQREGYTTNNKRAVKFYEEARQAPRAGINKQTGGPDYQSGIELLQKALDRDEDFLEAHQLIGEFYRITNNSEKAVHHFKRSLEINPRANLNGVLFFDIGELQMRNAEYKDALKYFDEILNNRYDAISGDLEWGARMMRENALFAIEAMKNPFDINPINIGPGINTEHPEYFPTLTVDGKIMLFTREVPANNNSPRGQEDFFVSELTDENVWGKAFPMPPHINTPRNEGAPTLSADGRTLIFVACADETGNYGEGRNGYGSCDLFITTREGNTWSKPKNLPGKVNTYNWESQPSLSSDGKTLYFVRRVGQRGTQRSDIFVTTLGDDGKWGKPVPLPENINTGRMETSVHIHPDGKTLYFSSNGHIGMGGYDIFMTQKQPNGSWSDPKNLGYPINTENDENSLLVGPDGDIAFFASDRPGGFGNLDIYYFEMPEELRPTRTTYFEGLVFDITDKKPLGGKFELVDLETGEQVIKSEADNTTGEFLVALPTQKRYALNVSYPGYAFYSKNFNMIERDDLEALHMDIPLIPTGTEGAIKLENVFFDLGKSTLREESFVELNKLYGFLKENESIRIEIGGHTDTRGDAQSNQVLSQNRAKAVYDYIVDKGISKERMNYKGYGQQKPINTDEEIEQLSTIEEKERAHQENRRTEYRILK